MKRLRSALLKSTATHLLFALTILALLRFRPSWLDSSLRLGAAPKEAVVNLVWSSPIHALPKEKDGDSSTATRNQPKPHGTAGSQSSKPSGALVVPEGAPEYPLVSRKSGEQGKVTVGFSLASDGTAKDVSVIQSSGHARLDNAALDFIRTTRLTTSGRIPSGEPLRLEFIFSLKN